MRAWYSIIIFFVWGLAPKASGQELAKLVASDAAEDDYFGRSVAVSGDLAAAGAYGNGDAGSSSGSAYVFRTTNDGASWTQTAKLVASDAAAGDFFARRQARRGDAARLVRTPVAVSGDLVVVGADGNDDAGSDSGSAYVFRTTNDGASWTQVAKLVASDAAEDDWFGYSVAVSGDLVVVGARYNDDAGSDSGSAYVFRTTNDGVSWTQTAKLVASDAAEDDNFGDSVAVSGDLVVVGAAWNDDAGSDSGSAYVCSGGGGGGGGGGGADTIVVAAAAVAAVVAVAIACVCIKRRRPKAAAARADLNVEAPPDRDDAFAGGAWNVAAASTKTPATKTPAPSARYQQLMRESEGVVARGMTAARVLLTAGRVMPVIGPVCEAAQDILRSVDEHLRKSDDVLMAGRRVVDVLGALQQMSANAAKLESGNADLVESKMRKLKGLLCDFKLAVDAFGREGWLKRAFLQHGRINSLTKLDKEITTCLESLQLDYKLAMDAEILERTYQMEQSITMLVAKRCSETREDPAAAAAILAQTPFAIARSWRTRRVRRRAPDRDAR
ncbi:hypothetical protein JL720_8246 [Aureococcus anophagefferens]|nr:hypothetical protein JL720_8246 [Aureococcus anophagefferens]